MVSIVIVSHSEKLAEGVKELALQMSQNKVKIFAAGGLNDISSPIGTDPFKIKDAIEKAYSDDGILVLMDIGSAIMSAEVATEMLEDAIRNKVLLCEAPLVEGAIAAAAQAMVGSDLKTVSREAVSGLLGKVTLLKKELVAETGDKVIDSANSKEIRIKVPNKLGLHARPSVRLVELINRFGKEVSVAVNAKPAVSASSISQVATLGAKQGDMLVFKIPVEGNFTLFENELFDFASNNFGDSDTNVLPVFEQATAAVEKAISNGTITGIASSKGISIGKVKLLNNVTAIIEKQTITDSLVEVELLKKSVNSVLEEFKNLQQKTNESYGKSEAEIFYFHIQLLKDSSVQNSAEALITNEHLNAGYAWCKVYDELVLKYQNMENLYFRERVSDILEIRNKVLDKILGSPVKEISLTEPFILVVDEIGPAQTLSLETGKILGILSKTGGSTSHATILARSLGIPAITGLGNQLDLLIDNDVIAMNGSTGEILLEKLNPDKVAILKNEKVLEEKNAAELVLKAKLPAISKDEIVFSILANISSPKEAELAYKNGAEGIGLYRTEFLFMNRDTAPNEEEQYEIYREVCQNMNGLPITIRTIDVGGDKPIPYLGIAYEKNPFLGLRGIRYCFYNADLFKTQLRALCRISADFEVRIMYPMVGVVEEVLMANKILREVQADLEREGIMFSKIMKIGIMVEVPSVIYLIPKLANEIDFLSIGTNDLTQYLLAIDRENQIVSEYNSALHPAVLSALEKIVNAAKEAKLDLSLCGEIARNPESIQLLSAIGIRKFSMSSPAIPEIKAAIRELNLSTYKYSSETINKWTTLQEVKTAIDN